MYLSRTLALLCFHSPVARRSVWLGGSVPLLAAVGMWLSGPAPTARADEVFSNFDSNGAFHPGFNSVAASARGAGIPFGAMATRFAAAFQATGSDFKLDSVTLPLSQAVSAGVGDFLVVRLAAEAPGGGFLTMAWQGLWGRAEEAPGVRFFASRLATSRGPAGSPAGRRST